MDQQSANVEKIHEYITSLDKGQRKNNRVRFLFYLPLALLFLVMLAGLGYYLFFYSPSKPPPESIDKVALQSFDQLNLTSVRQYFQQADGEEVLLVQLPETNEIVSLNSEQEYWELVDQMALRFINEEELLEEDLSPDQTPILDTLHMPGSDDDTTQPEEILDFSSIAAATSLAARGPKTEGVPLVFTIGNYQPNLDYRVDFGNGIDREKLGRRFSYTYRRRGRFTAILYGYHGGEEVLKKSLFLSIKRAPRKATIQEEKRIVKAQTPQVEEEEKAIEEDADVFEVMPIEEADGVEESPLERSSTEEQEKFLSEESLPITEDNLASPSLERGEASSSTVEEEQEDRSSPLSPLMVASQMPSFPGGETKMMQFLNTRLKYPQAAQDYHIEGIVYVQFVVQVDGQLTGHKVLKGLGYGCDEEALRITRAMPLWVSGRQNNRPVPVIMTLPVNFELLR